MALLVLVALALWAFTYRLGAAPLLDDPNEGEYAEVAREMVETGDWISPRLNYVLFLNKPPLAYWMIGASYLAFGVDEFAARLPVALAACLIIVLVAWLGTLLFDSSTGLLAGFVLLATGGFFVETHEVRPDLFLTVGLVASLVAIASLLRSPPRQDRWSLLGLQAALAVGLLAKGMVALIVPGCVFIVLTIIERRFDLLGRLLHPRGWWLFALLAVPWHAVMSLLHTGFLWDYVINQHVLFFFDQKFPRDSTPVSLGMFWLAFVLRLFPWTVFLPLAMSAAFVRARRSGDGFGDRFVLAWVLSVLLFFSAAASRMEHYSIPALPAAALLIARLFREYARERAGGLSRVLTAHVVVFATAALAGPFVVPAIVGTQDWLAAIHELPALARGIFAVFAGGMVLASVAALLRRRAWVAPAIVATFIAIVPSFQRGMAMMARVNSSAPMAAALRPFIDSDDTIVYEAPMEYQNCAGLNFYLRRKLDLLRPVDFVAPPYLEPHTAALFIDQDRLQQLWQDTHTFFITDPLLTRHGVDGVVPKPVYIVARDSTRWAVSNQPLH